MTRGSDLTVAPSGHSTGSQAVASVLERFCAQELAEPVGAVLYRPGVGLVVGLRLADGATVVIKVHRWNVSEQRLAAVREVQRHLADAGLPAPGSSSARTPTCG